MSGEQAFALSYFIRNGVPYAIDAAWRSLQALGYVVNRAAWELTPAGEAAIVAHESQERKPCR